MILLSDKIASIYWNLLFQVNFFLIKHRDYNIDIIICIRMFLLKCVLNTTIEYGKKAREFSVSFLTNISLRIFTNVSLF